MPGCGVLVSSSSLLIRSHHGRCQAKIPLSPPFKFAEPPLTFKSEQPLARPHVAPARHYQHVALGKLIERAAQLDAVGPRAACCFFKDTRGSSGAQLLHLRIEALAVQRYSCIAQNHGMILGYILHLKSPFLSMGFYLQKS
jgi:hypothetical protein